MQRALLNDWQKVGNDMRVAFGFSVRSLDIDNIFGQRFLSVFNDRRINQR